MRVIKTSTREIDRFITGTIDAEYYDIGQAYGHLVKSAGVPTVTHALAGRLYLSKTGWLLLNVPNALVRGLFDALDEQGVELPPQPDDGILNAHITVMTDKEVEQIGGGNNISERGHSYRFNLGRVKEVKPSGWDGISKVWFVEIYSPELQNLRKSYGLSALPNGDHPLHISFGVRRTNAFKEGSDKTADIGNKRLDISDIYDGPAHAAKWGFNKTKDTTKALYGKMEQRYGPGMAKIIMASYAVGAPVPGPMSGLLTAGPVMGVGEIMRLFRNRREKKAEEDDKPKESVKDKPHVMTIRRITCVQIIADTGRSDNKENKNENSTDDSSKHIRSFMESLLNKPSKSIISNDADDKEDAS